MTGGLRVDTNYTIPPAVINATASRNSTTNSTALSNTTIIDITENNTINSNLTKDYYVPIQIYDLSVAFNQRRFYVFMCFIVIAANIATSSISERCQIMPLLGFIVF